jgi:hypothetical protein
MPSDDKYVLVNIWEPFRKPIEGVNALAGWGAWKWRRFLSSAPVRSVSPWQSNSRGTGSGAALSTGCRRRCLICRAIGVTPRTLEIWDDIGIARDIVDAGIWITGLRSVIQRHPPRDEYLDLSDLPYGELGVPQYETERVLADHLAGFGIMVERGIALASLDQRESEVAVRLEAAGGANEAVA